MIKEAIEKIVDLSKPNYHVLSDDRVYVDKAIHLIRSPSLEPLRLNTLTGLIDYLKENRDTLDFSKLLIHVINHQRSVLQSCIQKPEMVRKSYAICNTEEFANDFLFGHFFDPETFIIKLQTNFVRAASENVMDNDIDIILRLLGTVRDEYVTTSEDDGISQSVMVKKGVALTEKMTLPNPVNLLPYRTFREIEQPASPFIFRARTGQEGKLPTFALFEADGSQWKLTAIQRIKTYLEKEITEIPIIA